jgi:hypothetical protein
MAPSIYRFIIVGIDIVSHSPELSVSHPSSHTLHTRFQRTCVLFPPVSVITQKLPQTTGFTLRLHQGENVTWGAG